MGWVEVTFLDRMLLSAGVGSIITAIAVVVSDELGKSEMQAPEKLIVLVVVMVSLIAIKESAR